MTRPSRAKHSESDPPPRYPSPPPYDQADETPTARTPLLLAHRTHVIRVENTHVRGNESVRRDEEDETNFCGDMGGPGTYYSWLLLRSLAYALFWFGMILGFAMAGRMVWAWGWSGGQEKNVEVVRIGIVGKFHLSHLHIRGEVSMDLEANEISRRWTSGYKYSKHTRFPDLSWRQYPTRHNHLRTILGYRRSTRCFRPFGLLARP